MCFVFVSLGKAIALEQNTDWNGFYAFRLELIYPEELQQINPVDPQSCIKNDPEARTVCTFVWSG